MKQHHQKEENEQNNGFGREINPPIPTPSHPIPSRAIPYPALRKHFTAIDAHPSTTQGLTLTHLTAT